MLNYLSDTIAIGNTMFGLSTNATSALWGMTVINDRYALVLIQSGGNVYWKKIDTYSDTVTGYDMTYTPTQAGIAGSDSHENSVGQFLTSDDTYLYYLKANTIVRIATDTGAASGSQTLQTVSSAAIPTNALNAIAIKGSTIYVASKSQQTIYMYNAGAWGWDGSPIAAAAQVNVPELISYNISGLFCQPDNDTDIVLLLKLGSSTAIGIKFSNDLSQRKGQTYWTDPSLNIHAAQFKGSILLLAQSDPTQSGVGIMIHRFGDASTNIVAKDQTILTLSEDRVKAGSGTLVKVTFIVKDGYGLAFGVSEKARISLVKVGDAFDKNDGALALTQNGPFRDSSDNPINTYLDVSFDNTGTAVCWWQAPVEVPVDILMYSIEVQFPIF